jgi:hypothetical protein
MVVRVRQFLAVPIPIYMWPTTSEYIQRTYLEVGDEEW